MGSYIEFDDTLQLTIEQGFPPELRLERHLQKPFTVEEFAGRVFEFRKPDVRLYHPAPTRVFLVHNLGGKWLYWGHVQVVEQTVHAQAKVTSGKFIITKIYTPEHQRAMSTYEVPDGKGYFSN